MKITITYRKNAITKGKHVIAVFESTDDLLCCIDFIKKSCFHTEKMKLYKYNKKYVILFPFEFYFDKRIFCLKEFAKIKCVNQNTVSHIKEYGILINRLKSLLK